MHNKQLIVFLGCKNSGKDYNSTPFINNGFVRVAFADPLRDMTWDILDYKPDKKYNYDEFKESKIILSKSLFKKKTITTGRKILQNVGSTIKHSFGETFWAKLWKSKVIETNKNTVCTDARFTYEIKEALSLTKEGYNVVFVWCSYSGADWNNILKDTHESEALAQYIYYNQDKYGLTDGCKISHKTIKDILKDYETND